MLHCLTNGRFTSYRNRIPYVPMLYKMSKQMFAPIRMDILVYIYIAYISIHASPLSLASHACPSVCVYGWYLRCVAYSSFTSHTLSRCVSTTLCIYMYMFVCVKESDRQHKTSVNAHLNSPSALIRSCFLLYIVFSHTAQHLARMQTHKAGQTETATDDRRLQQFHIDVSMIYPNSYGEWVHKKTEYFSKV